MANYVPFRSDYIYGLRYDSYRSEKTERLRVQTELYVDDAYMFCVFGDESKAVTTHSYNPKTGVVEERKYIPHIYNPYISANFSKHFNGEKVKYSIWVRLADYGDFEIGDKLARLENEEDFVKTMHEVINWMRDFNRHLFTGEEIFELLDKIPAGEAKWGEFLSFRKRKT